ncbi:hypothetical protein BCR34DRAFT_85981 [Clohesyomyces aquaticus]|uniref:Uncharacterized protein n=1 Tax=Clohesyomyces aquaticus TaxID=1231657 RepID=A0A1Y2A2K4_9PLEO|nr:hypothetical protein BCR34DRAFT_85981 [Clohesyomyces aquaticus]
MVKLEVGLADERPSAVARGGPPRPVKIVDSNYHLQSRRYGRRCPGGTNTGTRKSKRARWMWLAWLRDKDTRMRGTSHTSKGRSNLHTYCRRRPLGPHGTGVLCTGRGSSERHAQRVVCVLDCFCPPVWEHTARLRPVLKDLRPPPQKHHDDQSSCYSHHPIVAHPTLSHRQVLALPLTYGSRNTMLTGL